MTYWKSVQLCLQLCLPLFQPSHVFPQYYKKANNLEKSMRHYKKITATTHRKHRKNQKYKENPYNSFLEPSMLKFVFAYDYIFKVPLVTNYQEFKA